MITVNYMVENGKTVSQNVKTKTACGDGKG